MAVRVFPAAGVVWIVDLPTGPAAETVWPGMVWIEAPAPISRAASGDALPEKDTWKEAQAA